MLCTSIHFFFLANIYVCKVGLLFDGTAPRFSLIYFRALLPANLLFINSFRFYSPLPPRLSAPREDRGTVRRRDYRLVTTIATTTATYIYYLYIIIATLYYYYYNIILLLLSPLRCVVNCVLPRIYIYIIYILYYT